MSDHARSRKTPRKSWWRSAKLRAVLSLGVVLGIGSIGTFAFWTDSVTVSGTTFTAGTLVLNVNGSHSPAAYTSLNITNMVPGNTTAGILTVKNNGTAPLKYLGSAAATDTAPLGLGAALTVKITADAAVTGASPTATCAGTALSGTGTALNTSFITPGRLLAPGATETLCVQVTLPSGASTTLQGGSTAVVFTFTGTSDLS